jgi:hypothetical protein
MRHAGLGLAIASVVLGGCTGVVFTAPVTADELRGPPLEGVIYYPPYLAEQVMKTTLATDKDGHVLANEAGAGGKPKCVPVETSQVVTLHDYGHPRRVAYKAAPFEAHTFNVTLDANGSLLGVNSQSTPDQGKTAQTAVATAGALVPLVGLLSAGDTQPLACNAGSVLVEIRPIAPK